MKILYVEDELAQNMDRVLRLFGDTVLSKKQKDELVALRNDEYGASNEDVRTILSRSGVLDVETSFPDALRLIENAAGKYDLFIVDRQLATDENAYSVEELASIVTDYDAEDHADYLTREGDYLLMRLLQKGDMARVRMFYFMTGFTDDVVNTQESLREYMKIGWFQKQQILEKGSDEHLAKLCGIIEQSHILSVRNRYMNYFEALEAITPDQENLHRLARLLEACEECKKPSRGMVMGDARTLLESVVGRCCKMNGMRVDDSTNENLNRLGPKWNNDRKRLEGGHISRPAMSLGKTAYTLCSVFGSHDDPRKPEPEAPSGDVFACTLYAIRAFVLEVTKNTE